jgi:hypothetical protein
MPTIRMEPTQVSCNLTNENTLAYYGIKDGRKKSYSTGAIFTSLYFFVTYGVFIPGSNKLER